MADGVLNEAIDALALSGRGMHALGEAIHRHSARVAIQAASVDRLVEAVGLNTRALRALEKAIDAQQLTVVRTEWHWPPRRVAVVAVAVAGSVGMLAIEAVIWVLWWVMSSGF